MNVPVRRRAPLRWRWLLPCLAAGALASVLKGQDASWDLRNYHLYNAWAFLTDRGTRDIAAASLQSSFNPLPDLPYFMLLDGPLRDAPRLLAAVQGLWAGWLAFCLIGLAQTLATLQGRRPGLADALAVLIGLSGTMLVSQVGLSSNEVPLAGLVVAALGLACREFGAAAGPRPSRLVLAGVLAGLAAGLKPTAIVYPLALGLAALVVLRPAGRAALAFSLLGGAALAGFLAAYGAWGWHLYQLTGNPVFPLFNGLFHSPWAPPASLVDTRFLPRSAGQWLAYPFYWLGRTRGLVTEAPFADPRYALALLAVLALVARQLTRRTASARPAAARAVDGLVAFWVIGYLLWLALFSILRYAIPLEATSGLLVLAAVRRWRDGRTDTTAARGERRAMGAALLVCAALTHYPDWGHVPFSRRAIAVQAPELPARSLVLVEGTPIGYLLPFLGAGQDVRFVGLNWFSRATRGFRLYDRLAATVAAHRGPVFILHGPEATDAERQMRAALLPASREQGCTSLLSSLERDRHGRPRQPAPTLCRLVAAGKPR